MLSNKLGKSFDYLKNKLFKKYNKGFYVYAEPKKFPNFKSGVEYVTRYGGRPAISENRILNYDGNNVTFCYNEHTDGSYHEITVTAIEFIKILLRHLIPYNFRTIRYYGFYRKKHENHDKMVKMVNEAKKMIRKQFLKHRLCLLKFFNRDPYSCPKCGTIYNLISNPPKIMDYCDICDTKLELRKDDNEEVARARFVTYEEQTAPLYDYFKQMGILQEIKADGTISEIWENLKEVVFDE